MTVFKDINTFHDVHKRRAYDRGQCRRCAKTAAGFTLLEVVTVLVIAAVLAAVLAPRFIGATGFTGQTTADKLLMAARYAETLAQNQGVTTSLTIGANSFSVTQNGGVAVANPTLQSASFVVPLPAGVTITSQPTTTTVSFARPGVPNATPIFTVAGPGSTVRIDVTATGYIYECGPQGTCLP